MGAFLGDGIIRIDITKSMRARARKSAKWWKEQEGNTGFSVEVSCLGKEVARDFLGKVTTGKNPYAHDFIYKGKKIFVRTLHCTSVPKKNYEVSMFFRRGDDKWKKKKGIFLFVRIHEETSTAYIVGFRRITGFFEDCFFRKRGFKRADGFVYKEDSYNMKIADLKNFSKTKVRAYAQQ